MKDNADSQQEGRSAHPFNFSLSQGKTRIVLGLCVVLGAGLISIQAANTSDPAAVRAADTSAQAAPPASMDQKQNAQDRLQTPPSPASLRLPVLITPSGIVKKPHRIYAAIRLEKC